MSIYMYVCYRKQKLKKQICKNTFLGNLKSRESTHTSWESTPKAQKKLEKYVSVGVNPKNLGFNPCVLCVDSLDSMSRPLRGKENFSEELSVEVNPQLEGVDPFVLCVDSKNLCIDSKEEKTFVFNFLQKDSIPNTYVLTPKLGFHKNSYFCLM